MNQRRKQAVRGIHPSGGQQVHHLVVADVDFFPRESLFAEVVVRNGNVKGRGTKRSRH
ncbi:MAG: CotD family spore coat protein [Spirochaetaceae bacterium]|nr:CotD family spore coat protein [Spirochaetaceae bacterium]